MTHTGRNLELALGTALLGLGIAARVLRRVEIDGASMRPTFEPGDRLVVVPVWSPKVGDLVAVTDPRARKRLLVKRIAEIRTDGYVVVGDNPSASTDSRHFGPISRSEIRGRVLYRYAPDDRRGRV